MEEPQRKPKKLIPDALLSTLLDNQPSTLMFVQFLYILYNYCRAQNSQSKCRKALKPIQPVLFNKDFGNLNKKVVSKTVSPLFRYNACCCIAAPLNLCSMMLNESAWFCQWCSIASKPSSKKATAKTAQNKNS
jgi:hypothetical protein